MNKRVLALFTAILLFLVLMPATVSAASSGNLLQNPSFEDGLNGWICPDGKWGTVERESRYVPQDGEYFALATEASNTNLHSKL